MNNITVNQEQRLYVIPNGKYYSCFGFDNAYNKSKSMWNWLVDIRYKNQTEGIKVLKKDFFENFYPHELIGTTSGYEKYQEILGQVQQVCKVYSIQCDIDLIPELIAYEGMRVEVVDKYGETQRFWVGKSTGFIPCHLQIKRSDSISGTPVMGTPFQSIKLIKRYKYLKG